MLSFLYMPKWFLCIRILQINKRQICYDFNQLLLFIFELGKHSKNKNRFCGPTEMVSSQVIVQQEVQGSIYEHYFIYLSTCYDIVMTENAYDFWMLGMSLSNILGQSQRSKLGLTKRIKRLKNLNI